jgi:hypothetical protein
MKLTRYEIFLSITIIVLVVIYFITLNNNQKNIDLYEEQIKANHAIGWVQGYVRGVDLRFSILESGDYSYDETLASEWYTQDSLFVESLKKY